MTDRLRDSPDGLDALVVRVAAALIGDPVRADRRPTSAWLQRCSLALLLFSPSASKPFDGDKYSSSDGHG